MKTPQEEDGPRLLTTQKVIEYLGISYLALRNIVLAGDLPVVRFPGGRKWYFDRKDIEAFIQKKKFRLK